MGIDEIMSVRTPNDDKAESRLLERVRPAKPGILLRYLSVSTVIVSTGHRHRVTCVHRTSLVSQSFNMSGLVAMLSVGLK